MKASPTSVFVAVALCAGLSAQTTTGRAATANVAAPPNSAPQETPPTQPEGRITGWEAGGGAGTAFRGTYAFGVEGRMGYTLPQRIYLGGNVQLFWGNTETNQQQGHATFLGGEVGYKFLPNSIPLEVRPYAFVGPAFISQVSDNPATNNSHTNLAVQPGVLGNYRFGSAFVGGDMRLLATPSPTALALMLNGGSQF
jgi:hypothetical protein